MFVFDCADWPFVDLSVNANQTDAMSHRKWYGEKIVRNRRIWYPLLHIWAKRRYESLVSGKTVIGWNYLCIIKVALCCAQKDYIQEGLFPTQGSNIHGLRGCVLLIFFIFHICHNNLIQPGVKWNAQNLSVDFHNVTTLTRRNVFSSAILSWLSCIWLFCYATFIMKD